MNTFNAISPIDGRYRKITEPLAGYFSERAFIMYRVRMEEAYLAALGDVLQLKFKKIKPLEVDAEAIKKIEQTTNHDLKAIEYWMKSKLPKNMGNWIHFGLTSEDATNIAYGLMTMGALHEVIIPALEKIFESLKFKSLKFKSVAMLARTHGQPASPTTFGKEMAVFSFRLARQLQALQKWRAPGKLNGATGNYNALVAAYPKVDWVQFSKKFVESFGLEWIPLTTQIESHDSYAELFDNMRRINSILINLNQDLWRYISDGWLKQKAIAGEVGSSTMPHKINPIKFENSEGNLGLANALLQHFALKLPISRLQRDLSDSTVMRSMGSAFAYSLIGYKSLLEGLERVEVDTDTMLEVVNAHPEVLAEAIQTILRRDGISMPYEKLKALTRGNKITLEELRQVADLKTLTPEQYIGLAKKLATWRD